jgi:hypothetical protein
MSSGFVERRLRRKVPREWSEKTLPFRSGDAESGLKVTAVITGVSPSVRQVPGTLLGCCPIRDIDWFLTAAEGRQISKIYIFIEIFIQHTVLVYIKMHRLHVSATSAIIRPF